MTAEETFYMMALTRIHPLSLINAHALLERMGSAQALFEQRHRLRDAIPDLSDRIAAPLRNCDEALRRAEAELEFAGKKNIRCICCADRDYPRLLRQCADAPLVLYYLGNADLNSRRVVSVVGTRRLTQYGKDLCQHFVAELQKDYPDTVVVSGLAYGADIHAHRAALQGGMQTVAVLAHGLDTIYPSAHRATAAQMAGQGGLLTEYMSHTNADKGNFVRRNRIVAGMAQATVVVESAETGGALITAELANSYDRDVCAFPGRVFDERSAGCNRLIARQQAHLVQTMDDFYAAVGWESPARGDRQPKQQELFPELADEERRVLQSLDADEGKQVNQIVVETNIPYHRVSATLFELEIKGLVAAMGGARFRKKR